MKICYVASSGGHWEELLCLKELFPLYESIFVTEAGGQADEAGVRPLYTVEQINRKEKAFFLHFLRLFRKAKTILRQEDPDLIVTTGALIAFPFCLIGKLRGKKIVYIESFARVDNRSLTGRLCYPLADLFLVQWETMKHVYPKSIFVGGLF